jgi:hypothetical protein
MDKVERSGVKHLVECHCVLPQLKGRRDPIYHKFVVFSIIEGDQVISKHAQCNNCGVIHKVTEIGASEILTGKEELGSIPTIEDIRMGFSDRLNSILDNYDLDLATWEECQFILDEERWGSRVVLKRDLEGDEQVGKHLIILGPNRFRIQPWSHAYQVNVEGLDNE